MCITQLINHIFNQKYKKHFICKYKYYIQKKDRRDDLSFQYSMFGNS